MPRLRGPPARRVPGSRLPAPRQRAGASAGRRAPRSALPARRRALPFLPARPALRAGAAGGDVLGLPLFLVVLVQLRRARPENGRRVGATLLARTRFACAGGGQ